MANPSQPPPYAPYSQYQGFPQAPYPPQPAYNPQPVYMYPPPAPQMQMQQQQQQTNVNVTVGQPSTQVVVVKRGVNHLLHFLITLLFFPWIFVWICVETASKSVGLSCSPGTSGFGHTNTITGK